MFTDVEQEIWHGNLAPLPTMRRKKTLSRRYETLPADIYVIHDDKCYAGLNLTCAVMQKKPLSGHSSFFFIGGETIPKKANHPSAAGKTVLFSRRVGIIIGMVKSPRCQ